MCALITKENIKKNVRRPYTPREIVEDEYPEMFETGKGCLCELEKLQEKVVELLPSNKKQVTDSQNNRGTKEAQAHLLNYLKLRSLYSFACKIDEQVNLRCRNLAVCDEDQEEKEIVLAKSYEAFGKVDFGDIVQDDKEGFRKLVQAVKSFGKRTDFMVMECWSFLDIVGTLNNGGSSLDDLWKSAIDSLDPTKHNIGGLMESEEDNRMVRVY